MLIFEQEGFTTKFCLSFYDHASSSGMLLKLIIRRRSTAAAVWEWH